MKITRIYTDNFIGARAVDLAVTKPVALIAGQNGAGKSSIRDAIAFAFTADLTRVNLKKDAPDLVSDGAESAAVEIDYDGSRVSVAITGAGKIVDSLRGVELPPTLPYVLDAQRFARLDDKARRDFLFGLMGIKIDGPAIRNRLLAKGCSESKVERIIPILRTGFEAAAGEASSKARDAKASWKTLTYGETWGKDKAVKWQPAPLEFDAKTATELLAKARAIIAADDADIGTLQQEIGAARKVIESRQQSEARRLELHAKAEKIVRIQEKLNVDSAELAAWETKVADCRKLAGAEPIDPKSPGEFLLRGLATVTAEFLALSNDYPEVDWPSELLNRAAAHHAEYVKLHGDPIGNDAGPDPEAIAKLPEYENALALMQRAVANGKRDLDEATAAKAEYDRLIAAQGEPLPDIDALQAKLREITARRDTARADESKYTDMATKAASRDELLVNVAAKHQDVMEWTDIADALAPDGIPGDLLTESLDPINELLLEASGIAEWQQVVIHSDMRITYGLRDYNLLSESEKWRADAMIAAAVSKLSGLRLLVLDRVDVLDIKGREDLMYWLDGMAEDGDIDTALIFGTLKSLPAQLLPNIEAHWIENGVAGQMKEAA